MNPTLKYSLMLRLLLTPLLFATRYSITYTVLMLIFLDIIDCNPVVLKLFPAEYEHLGCSYDATYQHLDKLLDIFQYIVALLLLRPLLPYSVFVTIALLMVYRVIGMAVHSSIKDNKVYIVFIDFIKEYLLLFAAFGLPIPVSVLAPAIALKVGYEYLMHSRHIFLDLYRAIF